MFISFCNAFECMVKAITSSVQLPATFMLPLSQMQIKLRSQSDLGQASL